MRLEDTRFVIGGRWVSLKLAYDLGRVFFVFNGYNPLLNAEIKLMSGHQYHGFEGAPLRDFCVRTFRRDKLWSARDDQHNRFHIAYLQGKKPYARYQAEMMRRVYERALYVHQSETADFILSRKQCIIAEEMGIGKTLSEISAREIVDPEEAWYVAPRSALKAVEKELRKWQCRHTPAMMTYQGLVARVKKLEGQDIKPPQWLTFDESSCVKTPTSQRSQAAKIMADAVREAWGDDAYIVLMSGTPAPKSPLDWWMQCEIACPGFLIEGNINDFKKRLAILVDRDFGNGIHPHIQAWRDRDDICDTCGKAAGDPAHLVNSEMVEAGVDDDAHEFKPAKNEVAYLKKRIIDGGLVIVKFKKDCLDLPEKRYEEIELEPSRKILQLANLLASTAPTVAEALIRLRTLSDGFQYGEQKCGEEICRNCAGQGERLDFILKPGFADLVEGGWTLPPADEGDEDGWRAKYYDRVMLPCVVCKGTGKVDKLERTTKEVSCPKDDALKDLIEQHSEIGRLVVYAGFTGSVDRCVRIFKEMGWETIRWDGRGINMSVLGFEALDLFQDKLHEHPRVGFIGQPGAAGMGLTLTASPSCVYFSSTFNATDRIQSEDRVHRIGIKTCPTIFDLFHLPTDRMVFNNIQEKRARMDLSMGVNVSMAAVLEALRGKGDE